MSVSLLTGLAAALAWGLAQLIGGRAARTLSALPVALGGQTAGLVPLAVLVVLVEGLPADLTALGPSALGGAAGAAGLVAFYRAARAGRLSIVAPLAGAGIAVPVLVGLVRGDAPSVTAAAALLALLAGGALVGGPANRAAEPAEGSRHDRAALAWAVLAALGYGAFYLGLAASADAGPLAAVTVSRAVAVLVLAGAVVVTRPALPRGRAAYGALVVIGLIDVAGNTLFTVGTEVGVLAVVAATAALYPLVSVLFARTVLGERLSRAQAAGVTIVLVGLSLVAAG